MIGKGKVKLVECLQESVPFALKDNKAAPTSIYKCSIQKLIAFSHLLYKNCGLFYIKYQNVTRCNTDDLQTYCQ